MGVVYLVTNTVNGKAYVGKTQKTMEYRQKGHFKDARSEGKLPFHRALRKYGAKAFTWEVLNTSDRLFILNDLEASWIVLLRTKVPNGYNLTEGGEGITGYRFHLTKEARKKISASRTGKRTGPLSLEQRAKISMSLRGHNLTWGSKISAAKMGHIVSVETREKIRAALLGRKTPPDIVEKMRAALIGHKGCHHTPESRAKISAAGWGRQCSKETREKLKGRPAWNKGRHWTAEVRAKMSASKTGKPLSKEHREKLKGRPAWNKGKPWSEEARMKMSLAAKNRRRV